MTTKIDVESGVHMQSNNQAKSKNKFETFYLAVSILFMVIFLIWHTIDNSSKSTSGQNDKPAISGDSFAITAEQANEHIGTTLKDFCSINRKYINIRLYYSGENIGAGATSCAEVGKGYYFDDFVITQAYYDEEYLESPEYKYEKSKCARDNTQCKPLTVYVDSVPKDEAMDMVIKLK